MTSAEKFVAATILHRGPITFREFMELALYHPEVGYYTAGKERIGKSGDYFTSSSLGSIFGRVLARQLGEMLEILDGGVLVEMGAGKGYLARDILEELQALEVDASYLIVERSSAMIVPKGALKWFQCGVGG